MARAPKMKSKRGFAAMPKAKRCEIASRGGKAVPPEKRSFAQDPDLAKRAGHAGGKSPLRRRAVIVEGVGDDA